METRCDTRGFAARSMTKRLYSLVLFAIVHRCVTVPAYPQDGGWLAYGINNASPCDTLLHFREDIS